MKGKKADSDFIAEFISICAKDGILLKDEVINKAKKEIEIIDDKIKQITELKKKRSKLVDVVSSFEIKTKNNSNEKINLSFHSLKDLSLAKKICLSINILNQNDVWAADLSKEALLIVKQLINLKIIRLEKDSYKLAASERYNDFINFVDKVVNE